MKNLLTRRTIRKYTQQDVSDELLNRLMNEAARTQTMGNLQLYSVVVTRSAEMKAKLSPAHFNQPMVKEAPVVLTICADFRRFNRFCEFRQADTEAYSNRQSYQWAVTDALIAAQNACVAAESLGLGFCWLGTITYNVDKFVEVLELPRHVIPVSCVTMGYPAEHPALTQKLPVEAFVHRETYHDYDRETIDRLYAEKENSEETRQILEENQLDNLAQVFTQRRYTRQDNEHFAQVLEETLKRQGF